MHSAGICLCVYIKRIYDHIQQITTFTVVIQYKHKYLHIDIQQCMYANYEHMRDAYNLYNVYYNEYGIRNSGYTIYTNKLKNNNRSNSVYKRNVMYEVESVEQ